MKSARDTLIKEHRWFLHAREVEAFNSIKAGGLKPRNPGCAAPDVVLTQLGTDAKDIVCLHPLSTFDAPPKRDKKQFLMAIDRNELPARIGLDWSYGGCWDLAGIVKHYTPEMALRP